MTLLGLDFEGRVTDWARVKALGYQYAVSRCVGENGLVDPDYAPNVAGARADGLVPGAYHFIAHGTAAEHCKIFKGAIGDPAGLLIQLDVERPNYHPAPTFADVQAWFAEWRRDHPAHPVLLYTGDWYWDGAPTYLPNPNGAALTPYLWHSGGAWYRATSSAYPGDASSGWRAAYGGWAAPTCWQYHGSISLGIGPKVDINAFRGTRAQLEDLANAPAELGAGEEGDVPKAIFANTRQLASPDVVVVKAGAKLYKDPDAGVELLTTPADRSLVLDDMGYPLGRTDLRYVFVGSRYWDTDAEQETGQALVRSVDIVTARPKTAEELAATPLVVAGSAPLAAQITQLRTDMATARGAGFEDAREQVTQAAQAMTPKV